MSKNKVAFKYCEKCRKEWKSPKNRFYYLKKRQTNEYRKEASQRTSKWIKANYEQYRKNGDNYKKQIKYQALLFYSNAPIPQCVNCGETNIEVLALDHINNNGKEEKTNRGWIILRALKIKDKSQYQTLCYNCNWKKHIKNLADKPHGKRYPYYHSRNVMQKQKYIHKFSNGTNKCSQCGNSDMDVLSIDHIENNGHKHRKRLFGKNRGSLYGYLSKAKNIYRLKLQILCLNCNILKYRNVSKQSE